MNPESAALAAVQPAAEAGRTTRFFVFTASDDLLTFRFVAAVEANDRDQALRKWFGRTPPLSVAVSEHAWKVRKPKVEPVIRGLTDVDMPVSAAAITIADRLDAGRAEESVAADECEEADMAAAEEVGL